MFNDHMIPILREIYKVDELLKTHKWDGTVKSSKCKALENGDPPAGWGVQAKRGQS
jgi:hypothetical protein